MSAKLTAQKAQEMLADLQSQKTVLGFVSCQEEYYIQALEIALAVLIKEEQYAAMEELTALSQELELLSK